MTQDVQFVAPFFVLEGDEGTGKGTVAKLVVKKLVDKGIEVVHTREPGGTDIGEVLRKELLLKREQPLEKVTHILLHQAYRKEHIEKVILPSLHSGKVVLSERFFMSTLALNIMPYMETNPELYQLFMDTMPYIGSNVIEPVTILLDIEDEAVRKSRLTARELDFYESRTPEELQGTSNAYKMFQKHPATITLDATKDPEELANHIVERIEAQLELAKQQARDFAEAEAKRLEAEAQAATDAPVIPDELKDLDGDAPIPAQVEEVPFNLEEAVEGFLAENLIPALFNHDADQVPRYLPIARSFVLSIYNQMNDPALFEGQNRAQLRTNLHSIFHYGHQLDLIRDRMETKSAEAAAE